MTPAEQVNHLLGRIRVLEDRIMDLETKHRTALENSLAVGGATYKKSVADADKRSYMFARRADHLETALKRLVSKWEDGTWDVNDMIREGRTALARANE